MRRLGSEVMEEEEDVSDKEDETAAQLPETLAQKLSDEE